MIVAVITLSCAPGVASAMDASLATPDDATAVDLRGLADATAVRVALPAPALHAPLLDALAAPPLPDARVAGAPRLAPGDLRFLPFPLLPDESLLMGASGLTTADGAPVRYATLAPAAPAPPAPRVAPPRAATVEDAPAHAAAPEPAPAPAADAPASTARVQKAATAAPPTPARAGAVVAAGTAAVGVLALLGFSLYSRIRPNSTLANDTRKSIFDAVCGMPGLGVHAIAQRAGVSYSTTTYHLERLQAAGMIVMTPDGNKLCYYKNGGAFTEAERRILPILKNEEAARLFEAILDSPGTYRAALAERLGVTATTVNWHLKRLRHAGLVHETRAGRNAHLFANVDVLQAALPGLASKIATTDAAVAERLRRYTFSPTPSSGPASPA